MLRQQLYYCLKKQSFTVLFGNILGPSRVLYSLTTANKSHKFTVAYNNAHRILNNLPMLYTASNMFVMADIGLCTYVVRKAKQSDENK